MNIKIDRIKLAVAMARADLNTEQTAGAAGLARRTITRVKAGTAVTPETANKIAAGLGVPLAALLPE